MDPDNTDTHNSSLHRDNVDGDWFGMCSCGWESPIVDSYVKNEDAAKETDAHLRKVGALTDGL